MLFAFDLWSYDARAHARRRRPGPGGQRVHALRRVLAGRPGPGVPPLDGIRNAGVTGKPAGGGGRRRRRGHPAGRLPVHRRPAYHAPALGTADVPALGVRPGRGTAAAAAGPDRRDLGRRGLGRPGPVLHAGRHPDWPTGPLGVELLRDQRPHLRPRPVRAQRDLVLLARRGPAGRGRVARATPYRLPYFWASMRLGQRGDESAYLAQRYRSPLGGLHRGPVTSRVRVAVGEPIPADQVSAFEHFLTARWMLFSVTGGRPTAARACHSRWPLHRATAQLVDDQLITAAGLPGRRRPTARALFTRGGRGHRRPGKMTGNQD